MFGRQATIVKATSTLIPFKQPTELLNTDMDYLVVVF